MVLMVLMGRQQSYPPAASRLRGRSERAWGPVRGARPLMSMNVGPLSSRIRSFPPIPCLAYAGNCATTTRRWRQSGDRADEKLAARGGQVVVFLWPVGDVLTAVNIVPACRKRVRARNTHAWGDGAIERGDFTMEPPVWGQPWAWKVTLTASVRSDQCEF